MSTEGFHGAIQAGRVSNGSVVDEHLAMRLSDNKDHTFWYFCGQAATATAINFARGTEPTDDVKIMQLQWIHYQLRERHSDYRDNDPWGPYAASLAWLLDLMEKEKSNEFAITDLRSRKRDEAKDNMMSALDRGAYVVALNQTKEGIGHFLTVYAIDYQPRMSGGGTVFYGDVLYNKLDSVNFTLFLDRMLRQSPAGRFNAFSVKKI